MSLGRLARFHERVTLVPSTYVVMFTLWFSGKFSLMFPHPLAHTSSISALFSSGPRSLLTSQRESGIPLQSKLSRPIVIPCIPRRQRSGPTNVSLCSTSWRRRSTNSRPMLALWNIVSSWTGSGLGGLLRLQASFHSPEFEVRELQAFAQELSIFYRVTRCS